MLRYALLLSAALSAAAFAGDAKLAPTPPMGWNSWDAYGLTITEADFKANTAVLATMKSLGWTTAVIDEGWYMDNPNGAKLADRKYQLDAHGLLIPSLARFPSAAGGAGLKPLGDWVHGLGLKFGVHVVRGIPKDAVDADLPIAGSHFRSREAADKSDLCSWDDGNYGVRDNAAGQAYYDSMVKQYADWGVDYIKIDCIADHPYKATEIRQVHDAIAHSGRGIVLSLSPGPTNITHAEEVGRLSELWRIADDSWDGWDFAPAAWPNGILTGFKKLAEWHAYAKPGSWPDADMLPFGSLTPHPGWGEPRQSRLTADETRTWFTLWAIARSPLILGANLTKLDDGLKTLLTNKAVIAVNQTAWESYPVQMAADESQSKARFWMALAGSRQKPTRYLAVFNISDKSLKVTAPVENGAHALVDLWTGKRTQTPNGILNVTLPAHGSTIYRVQ
jgi:alpha-galactosidase